MTTTLVMSANGKVAHYRGRDYGRTRCGLRVTASWRTPNRDDIFDRCDRCILSREATR